MVVLSVVVSVLLSPLLQSGAWDAFVAAEAQADSHHLDPEAWSELGDAMRRVADTGRFGAADMWWQDALRAYERARALDPLDGQVLAELFDTHALLGNHAQVVSLGQQLIGAAVLARGAPSPGVLADVLRSQARLPRPSASDDPEGHEAALIELARVLDNARRLVPESPELALARASILADVGQRDRGLDVLAAALSASPDSLELHGRFIDEMVAEARLAHVPVVYERLVRAHPLEALVWWYGGSVQLLLAEQALRERDADAARVAIGRGLVWLERCGELEPDYAEAVRRSRARGRAARGWAALGEGELAGSRDAFLDVLATDPDLCVEPDGLGRSVVDGLGLLGARHEQAAQYTEGAELCQAVLAVQPEDGEWWNNLAYFLRQRGAQEAAGFVEVEGDADQVAQATFRGSWEAYLRAVEYAPQDVRIINDCALMQVYHLQDELDRARQLLERALATGESQLAEMGPEPDEVERFPVAQAMGDAWENLGYMAYHLTGDMDRARDCFEHSLASDSGYRPAVLEFLQVMDAGGPPIEQRGAGSDVRPPVEDGDRGSPPWSWDLEQAFAQSRAEQRPLIIYHRGEGLGLLVKPLDDIVTSAGPAGRMRAGVCALADTQRHAPSDRTARGEIVPCPRFGGPPCGVHVANAVAFAARWSAENDGAEPGESEETLTILDPEGALLTEDAMDWFNALLAVDDSAWRELVGVAPGDEALMQRRTQLATGDPETVAHAARELLADAVSGARTASEAWMSDPHSAPALRRALVAELARREELDVLGALCTREDDPALAVMALDHWPAGEDPAPLVTALLFSTSSELRDAALRNLLRVDPGPGTRELLVARRLLGDEGDRILAAEALGRLAARGLATGDD